MAVTTLYDGKGNSICFKQYRGRRFHPEMTGDIADTLSKISSLTFLEDDVLICSYPKSGSHWVYNIVQMLRCQSSEYHGSPFTFEFDDLTQMRKMNSSRTFLTHLSYPFIPEQAKQGNVKIISVLRNPKDVLCSMYEYQKQLGNKLFEGDFDGCFHYFLTDGIPTCGASWFTYVNEWEIAKKTNSCLKYLNLRYEDLKQDLYSNIVQLAKFLEVGHDGDFLRQLEQALTIDNLRREHSTQKGRTSKYFTWIKDGRLPIYRKGIIGNWKDKFTVKQNEIFDAVYTKKMASMSTDLDFVFQ